MRRCWLATPNGGSGGIAEYADLARLLRGGSVDRVVEHMNTAKRRATVCPERGGWVVVCLEETEAQHPLLMESAAKDLSGSLTCVAIGFLNHDDDVLAYWLADGGKLVDRYVSHPGALEGRDAPPEGGDARVLAEVVGRPEVEVELRRILHPLGGGHPPFAMALHEKLTQMLGLPPFTVGLSYMSENPLPDELDDDDIIEVHEAALRKEQGDFKSENDFSPPTHRGG